MDDLAADNPTTTTTDNLNGRTDVVTTNGTDQPGGQAPGATPAVDLFKGIDPNKLPPEARAAYDSMLRDYRDKTGKLSETIKSETAKAVESFRKKADQYDQIAASEEFVKQWNEFVQKTNAAPPAEEGDPALSHMKAQLQEISQKLQLSEMAQVTDAFAAAVDEKGEKLHPDFDKFNDIFIGKLGNGAEAEDFSLLRACVELADGKTPQEKLANGYKAVKQVYDAIFEEGKKAGMGRLQAKALNGTLPPSHSAGDMISVTDKKPKNAREALAMARKGQVVSRD